MSRAHDYTEEELALLTPAEREGLVGSADGEPVSERQRHLDWCKGRALEYLDNGDCRNAVSSMLSDLRKNAATANLATGGLGMIGMMDAASDNVAAVERWVEGFN